MRKLTMPLLKLADIEWMSHGVLAMTPSATGAQKRCKTLGDVKVWLIDVTEYRGRPAYQLTQCLVAARRDCRCTHGIYERDTVKTALWVHLAAEYHQRGAISRDERIASESFQTLKAQARAVGMFTAAERVALLADCSTQADDMSAFVTESTYLASLGVLFALEAEPTPCRRIAETIACDHLEFVQRVALRAQTVGNACHAAQALVHAYTLYADVRAMRAPDALARRAYAEALALLVSLDIFYDVRETQQQLTNKMHACAAA